jgi:microcystin-dependent protein
VIIKGAGGQDMGPRDSIVYSQTQYAHTIRNPAPTADCTDGIGGKGLMVHRADETPVLFNNEKRGVICYGGNTGDYKCGAWATAPWGWLLCDGSAVSRTTYSDLFALIGTTYGVGDGSTTFTLPDMRDGVMGMVGALFTTLGTVYGANTANLAHDHTPGNHIHTLDHTHETSLLHDHTMGGPDTLADVQSGSGENVSGANHVHDIGNALSTNEATDSQSTANTSIPTASNTGSGGSAVQSVVQRTVAVKVAIKW